MASNDGKMDSGRLDQSIAKTDDMFKDFSLDPTANDRKPVTAAARLTESVLNGASGFKTGFGAEVERSMPRTANLMGDLNKTKGDLVELKNSFQQELVPTVAIVKRAMHKSLPMAKNLLPNSVYSALEKKLAPNDTAAYRAKTEAEEEQSTIADSIGAMFKKTEAIRSQERKDEAAGSIMEQVASAHRHRDLVGILHSLDEKAYYHSQFLENEQTAWMKKMLELNFIGVFTAKKSLKIHEVVAKILENKLDLIIKNTGLPNEVKLHDSDRYNELSAKRPMAKWGEFANNFIGKVSEKVVKTAKDNLIGGLKMLQLGADAAGSGAEMAAMSGDAPKISNIVPKMVGKFLGTDMGRRFSDLISPITSRIDASAGNMQNNAAFMIKGLRDKLRGGSIPFGEFLASMLPEFDESKTIGNSLLDKADKPAVYDVMTRQTIVEIIPGYLSKMTKYLKDLVTGSDTEEEQYDVTTRNFEKLSSKRKNLEEWAIGEEATRGENSMKAGAAVKSSMKYAFGDKGEEDYNAVDADIRRTFANMGRRHEYIMPEVIRKFSKGEELSNDETRYLTVIFSGVNKKKEVAIALSSILFDQDGKVKSGSINRLMDNVRAIAGSEDFIDRLQLTDVLGERRNLSGLIEGKSGRVNIDTLVDKEVNVSDERLRTTMASNVANNDAMREVRAREKVNFKDRTKEFRNNEHIATATEWAYENTNGLLREIANLLRGDAPAASTPGAAPGDAQGSGPNGTGPIVPGGGTAAAVAGNPVVTQVANLTATQVGNAVLSATGIIAQGIANELGIAYNTASAAASPHIDSVTAQVKSAASTVGAINVGGQTIAERLASAQTQVQIATAPAAALISEHVNNAVTKVKEVSQPYADQAKTFVDKMKTTYNDPNLTPMEKVAFTNEVAKSVMADFRIEAEAKAEIIKEMGKEFIDTKGQPLKDKAAEASDYASQLLDRVKSKFEEVQADVTEYKKEVIARVTEKAPAAAKVEAILATAVKATSDKSLTQAEKVEVIATAETSIRQVQLISSIEKGDYGNELPNSDFSAGSDLLSAKLKWQQDDAKRRRLALEKERMDEEAEAKMTMGDKFRRSVGNVMSRFSRKKDEHGEPISQETEALNKVAETSESLRDILVRKFNKVFGPKGEEDGVVGSSGSDTKSPFQSTGDFHQDFLQYFEYRKVMDAVTVEAIGNIGLLGPKGVLSKVAKGGFKLFSTTLGAYKDMYVGLAKGAGAAAKGAMGLAGKAMPAIGAGVSGAFGLAGSAVKGMAGIYGSMAGATINAAGMIGKAFMKRSVEEYVDIYRKDQIKLGAPLMSAKDQEKYAVLKNGAKLQSSDDIKEPIFHSETGNVIITQEDITHGLVDKYNKKVSKGFYFKGGLIGSMIGAAGNLGKGALGMAGAIGKGLLGAYGSIFGGALTMGKGVLDVLVKGVGGVMSPLMTGKKVLAKLDDIYKLLKSRLPGKGGVEGDADGDGDRDGSLSDLAGKGAAATGARALPKPGDKGPKGGTINEKGEEVDGDGNILSTAADIANIYNTFSGGNASKGGRLGRLANIAKAGKLGRLGMAGKAGQAIFNGGSKVAGMVSSAGGRVAGSVMGGVARAATAGRALATAGMLGANVIGSSLAGTAVGGAMMTAGSAVAGTVATAGTAAAAGATAAMGAIGTGLAMIPVAGWVALGIAAAAAGGYKLFKALSNTDFFESMVKLRLSAYGLPSSTDPDDLNDFEDRLYELVTDKDYLSKGEMEDFADDFGLDSDDEDQMRFFTTWFSQQAIPVFGRYFDCLKALGIDYHDADDMDEDDEKAAQLEDILKQQMGSITSELSETFDMSPSGYSAFIAKREDTKKAQEKAGTDAASRAESDKKQEEKEFEEMKANAETNGGDSTTRMLNGKQVSKEEFDAGRLKAPESIRPPSTGNFDLDQAIDKAAPTGGSTPIEVSKVTGTGSLTSTGGTNVAAPAGYAASANRTPADLAKGEAEVATAVAAKVARNAPAAAPITDPAMLNMLSSINNHMSVAAKNTGLLSGIKDGLDSNLEEATKPSVVVNNTNVPGVGQRTVSTPSLTLARA